MKFVARPVRDIGAGIVDDLEDHVFKNGDVGEDQLNVITHAFLVFDDLVDLTLKFDEVVFEVVGI